MSQTRSSRRSSSINSSMCNRVKAEIETQFTRYLKTICFHIGSIVRPTEIIERTASVSSRYEIITDWSVYTIPYSSYTVFISILKSYRIHRRLGATGRPIRNENIFDSSESDTV